VPAPKVNWEHVAGHVAGRGSGFGESYNPFLQLKRYNASPVSVQTSGRVPPFKRRMHFLCRSEWLIAILLAWVGCHVREQLPLWPWRHHHLLYGYLPNFDSAALVPGTLELCEEAGIEHGTFLGTNIPYIWTIDLNAIFAWMPPEEVSCALISVKPLDGEQYSGEIDPIARGPEKLEIERRYSVRVACSYFVADRTLWPGYLLGQLEDLSAAAYAEDSIVMAVKRLLESRGTELRNEPPNDWGNRLRLDFGLNVERAQLATRFIIWNQFVDVDPSYYIDYNKVLRPGGKALIAAMRGFLQRSAP
jgi:hypothetical protein